MESNCTNYSTIEELQSRLNQIKSLQANVAEEKINEHTYVFDFPVDDSLDFIKCEIKDDNDTWVFVNSEASISNGASSQINTEENANQKQTSIWDWVGFSLEDVQQFKSCSKPTGSRASSRLSSPSSSPNVQSFLVSRSLVTKPSLISSSIGQSFLGNIASAQENSGYKNAEIDSRTYTRPKKRTITNIVDRFIEETESKKIADSTDNLRPLENICTVSPASTIRTPFFTPRSTINSSVSDSFVSCDLPNNHSLNSTYLMDNSKVMSTSSSSTKGYIDIDELTDIQLVHNPTELQNSTYRTRPRPKIEETNTNSSSVFDKIMQSKVQFKLNDTYNLNNTNIVDNSNTSTVLLTNSNVSYLIDQEEMPSFTAKIMDSTDSKTLQTDDVNSTGEDSSFITPPNDIKNLGVPIGFSTPTSKPELKRKVTYNVTKRPLMAAHNHNEQNGRLSDDSTDADVQSVSTEDLTEDQLSPINHESESPRNDLANTTFEMLPNCDTILSHNSTVTISPTKPNLKSPIPLNSTFRNSPLNTTFCKSTEVLNGGTERDNSGPEDECMSTASDSSFSSSSTHIRSVGEIQSIARLQEESLRQQVPKRRLAWTSNSGLSETVAELRSSIPKLSSDDANSDQSSDVSSGRYSPTPLNNNDRGAQPYGRIVNGRKPSRYVSGLKKFGGSTGALETQNSTSTLNSTFNYQSQSRMSGLRPPTMINNSSMQPPSYAGLSDATRHMSIRPPSLINKTGIRPPSASRISSAATTVPVPQDVNKVSGVRPNKTISRLPAPKFRSGLPKYNGNVERQ